MTDKADMISRIEDAMIDTLKKRLPQSLARIDAFDGAADNYDFSQADGSAVFVHYSGSTYSPGDDQMTNAYAPRRTLRWQVFVLVHAMKGKNDGEISANEAIEAVRLALQGQSVVGATPFLIVSDKLDAQLEGGRRYVLEFTHHIPAIVESRFDPENVTVFPLDPAHQSAFDKGAF